MQARLCKSFKFKRDSFGNLVLMLKGSKTASNRSRPLACGTTSMFGDR